MYTDFCVRDYESACNDLSVREVVSFEFITSRPEPESHHRSNHTFSYFISGHQNT